VLEYRGCDFIVYPAFCILLSACSMRLSEIGPPSYMFIPNSSLFLEKEQVLVQVHDEEQEEGKEEDEEEEFILLPHV